MKKQRAIMHAINDARSRRTLCGRLYVNAATNVDFGSGDLWRYVTCKACRRCR